MVPSSSCTFITTPPTPKALTSLRTSSKVSCPSSRTGPPKARLPATFALSFPLPECLLQIRNQVRCIFQSNGYAHCSRRNADPRQFLRAHVVVRAVNRQHHQRFRSAQTRRQQKKPHTVAEPPRRRQSALQVKRQHRAESLHLPFGQRMIRVRL